MSTDPGRIWGHYDLVTTTSVTAHTYPYGQGQPQHGIQLTMRKGDGYHVARMPADAALALTKAILGSYPKPDNDRLLLPAEVGAMFRVDAKTVSKWAASGRLRSIKTLGGHRRFWLSDVLASVTDGAEGEADDGV